MEVLSVVVNTHDSQSDSHSEGQKEGVWFKARLTLYNLLHCYLRKDTVTPAMGV